jgi:hypothetical protein
MSCQHCVIAVVGLSLATQAGCWDSRRIAVPKMDPDQAGAEAITTYDADGDGALAGPELDKCPGLKAALRRVDADKDGRLTAEEIAGLLRGYQQNMVGLVSVFGTVNMDGQPLGNALVTLVPEKFMGPAVESAQATTDSGGAFRPRTKGMDVDGVRCAVYRIEVSRKDAAGQETVPAKYNGETTLGTEVSGTSPVLNTGIEVILSSRK